MITGIPSLDIPVLNDAWDRWTGGGARDRARDESARSQALLNQLGEADLLDPDFAIPELEGLDPQNRLRLQGLLSAVRENANTLDGTAYDEIEADPRLREAQDRVLDRLREYSERGTTAEDEAAISELVNRSNQADRGRREAIDAQMKRRGMAGSGMDLASRLSSQQAAADQSSRAALQRAAQRNQNSIAATGMYGDMASAIRGQDFQRDSTIAGARDALDQFNASLSQGVDQRNADREMAADNRNLTERQRIADYNSQREDRRRLLNNQNNMTRYGLLSERNQYLNSLRERRNGQRNQNLLHRAGVHQSNAERERSDALASRQMLGQILSSGIGAAGAALGGA